MPHVYVVAEDHELTCQGIVDLITRQPDLEASSIHRVHDGPQLIELIARGISHPAVLTLDLSMPGEPKRLSLLRAALTLDPLLQVVVLSADDSPFLVESVINEGALAFVSKGSLKSVLLEAIRSARNGIKFIDPRIDISGNSQSAWSALTDREAWTVVQLCRGLRLKEIAATTQLRYKTLAEYRQGAMKKLGVKEPAALSTYLFNNGLAFLLDE